MHTKSATPSMVNCTNASSGNSLPLRERDGVKLAKSQPLGRTILRLPKVEDIANLKKSALYALMGLPPDHPDKFPTSVRLSRRAVGWYSDEVLAWVDSRKRTRTNEKIQTFGQQTLEAQV